MNAETLETAPAQPEPRGHDVLMFGNFGAGKSLLLSCISGMPFQSGISFLSGLTSQMCFQPPAQGTHFGDMDYRFGDTPALIDYKMAENAAVEIHKALNDSAANGRVLKIYFVMTTSAGQVQTSDLYTIKLVLDSIRLLDDQPLQPNSYAVIINKCSTHFLNHEDWQQEFMNMFMTPSKIVPHTTDNVLFLPVHDKLIDADNAFAEFPALVQHIMTFPGIPAIASAENIDVSNLRMKLAEAGELRRASR